MFGTFRKNFKIEKSMRMAEEEFNLFPSKIVSGFRSDMKSAWRAETRDMITKMGLNDHELTTMIILPFIGSISDRSHKEMIKSKIRSWLHLGLIRGVGITVTVY